MNISIVALRDWIEAQAPVAAAFRSVTAAVDPLWAAERSFVARAVPLRRQTFAAGRAAAREAIVRLGEPPCAILSRPQRDPIGPPCLIGSISHDETWALAAVAYKGDLAALGLDIERAGRLEPELLDLVCGPEERDVDPVLEQRGIDTPKLRFVAKEAAYKAIFPLHRRFIEFHSACVVFQATENRFSVTLAGLDWTNGLEGRFAAVPGWLCAVCFREV